MTVFCAFCHFLIAKIHKNFYMETSFTELRDKEVINVLSGKLLGNITDVIIDLHKNCVMGFVVPGCKSFFNILGKREQLFVPFSNICKIGEDVILVEVIECTKNKRRSKPVRVFDAGLPDSTAEPNPPTQS